MAERGIAVLRYDKRTYAHQTSFITEDVTDLTIHEETVEDAIRAANLIKKDLRIEPERVYIIGHSLGAIAAPRIDSSGGDFAGIVMLAGSPRPLWEIIHDQNMNFLKAQKLDETVRNEQEEMVRKQYEKAVRLKEMTNEEAMKETVFGMPALYFKDLDSFDIESYVQNLEKPILVLQGENDFQIFFEKDFAMWKNILKEQENSTLISYPGLNHFFIHYKGPKKDTIDEYGQPDTVSIKVIEDIANWIIKQED